MVSNCLYKCNFTAKNNTVSKASNYVPLFLHIYYLSLLLFLILILNNSKLHLMNISAWIFHSCKVGSKTKRIGFIFWINKTGNRFVHKNAFLTINIQCPILQWIIRPIPGYNNNLIKLSKRSVILIMQQ